MGSRRKSRALALQILFESEFQPQRAGATDLFLARYSAVGPAAEYARTLVEGVQTDRPAIDEVIEQHAENWSIRRMGRVDRNLLRIAIWELLYQEAVPIPVVINEAIDLAKRYGDRESGAFVNGVLDHFAHHDSRPLSRVEQRPAGSASEAGRRARRGETKR